MKKITTLAELMETIESTYKYCGLRGANEADMQNLERGYLDCSYDWEDGVCTDEQLSGTCAIDVHGNLTEAEIKARYTHALERYAVYTDTVLLVADEHQEYGVDDNEVILGHNGYGADVIAIVALN